MVKGLGFVVCGLWLRVLGFSFLAVEASTTTESRKRRLLHTGGGGEGSWRQALIY